MQQSIQKDFGHSKPASDLSRSYGFFINLDKGFGGGENSL